MFFQVTTIGNDLEWDYEDLPSTLDWTFNAFLDEYNRLYAFLNQMQQIKFLNPLETKENNEEKIGEQLKLNQYRYEEFLERSKKAVDEYPYLREDISCRVELLSAKWEILNHLGSSLDSPKEKGDQEKVMRLSGK